MAHGLEFEPFFVAKDSLVKTDPLDFCCWGFGVVFFLCHVVFCLFFPENVSW